MGAMRLNQTTRAGALRQVDPERNVVETKGSILILAIAGALRQAQDRRQLPRFPTRESCLSPLSVVAAVAGALRQAQDRRQLLRV